LSTSSIAASAYAAHESHRVVEQHLVAADEGKQGRQPDEIGVDRRRQRLGRRRAGHRVEGSGVDSQALGDCLDASAPGCEHVFVSIGATILHADLDAFYASVEQRDDPRLRGRPVIVGSGVVLAASYEAKAFGVRTAMGGGQARALCPQAVVVEPRMSAYSEASAAVFKVFERTTPLVEGLSIDEAFLDVGGLRRLVGPADAIAAQLRRDVRDAVGLPITVGVARTKFLAKVASAVAKPDGLLVVPPDRELAFLHPLPVEALWGVGPVTAEKLHDRGITSVREVAGLTEGALVAMLGKASGRHLHALAHNRDPRPVQVGRRRHSIGSQHALGWGPKSAAEVDAAVVALVDRVTRRMRSAGRVGRTVMLRLRFDDFSRATRSHTLDQATAQTRTILDAVRDLLATATPTIERQGITLVGISVGNLHDDIAVQLALPFERRSRGALDTALDEVRDRFGSSAVTRAVLLGRDHGPTVPLLPD
jgi:DNA polymerase IV